MTSICPRQVNVLVNVFIISIPSVQANAGDRHRRLRSVTALTPIANQPKACEPFYNVTENNQFFSPGYPAENYTNNTHCYLILRGRHTAVLDARCIVELQRLQKPGGE
ncbi:hypothetical protein JTB14_008785 [Gonioctena quinquepunctata]|nr:hypothetical protein JTB14_008785 [Gonioctena quinquepunctata]